MKVLYVVSRPLEINTSASIRNKATIQGLLGCGCEVDLLTTEPDKNHTAYDPSMASVDTHTIYVKLGGIQRAAKLGRKFKFLAPIKRIVARFLEKNNIYDNLAGFASVVKGMPIDLNQYDYIISSSDPKSSHLAVYERLRENDEFHGTWVQIWGDPFASDITLASEGIERIKREEHKLISAADRVIYVSKLTQQAQQKDYPDCADKMEYIPIPYVEKREDAVRDLKTVKTVELAYCGDYSSHVRDIRPLYECVNGMTGVHLTICGMSDLELVPTEKVTLYSRVNRSKVVEIETKADILVHLSNIKGSQIPGKIYQYSGTNKPILFILDGERDSVRAMFESYKRYFFADNVANDIASNIARIVNGMDTEIKNSPLEAFSPNSLAMQLLGKRKEEIDE